MRVTAEDIDSAMRGTLDVLRPAIGRDWSVPAGTLDWSCWETLEHLSDDLFAYAMQLAPKVPPLTGSVPIVCEPRRPGGPASTIFVEPSAGNAGLLQALDGCATLLIAVVRITPESVRAYHSLGVSDPAGFAAMGIVEILMHTYDVATGLGLAMPPAPDDLCDRVLRRLFPDAPADPDRWATLLWATGRGELPGRAALTRWRWYGEVR